MVMKSRILPALAAVLMSVLVGPAGAALIEGVDVIPDPFSPNGDGVFDEAALYYTLSDTAVVTITVSGDSRWGPDTLRQRLETPGNHNLWWDGTSVGVTVPDGPCLFVIEAQPKWAPPEEVEAPVTVDTEPPVEGAYSISPGRFSPDGDGVADSLLVSVNTDGSEPTDEISVSITREDGTVVDRLLSATGPIEETLYWNGRDDSGTLVDDGLYDVRFLLRDAAGNEAVSRDLVDLDTEPPVLTAYYPDPAVSEFRFGTSEGQISGNAVDRGGVVAVEYSVNNRPWEQATIVRADSLEWNATVSCDSCVPDVEDGSADLRIRAYDGTPTADGHGHVNGPSTSVPVLSFDVVFDVAPPIHESSSLAGSVTQFAPGQQISVTTLWDAPGYEVTADFSKVDALFNPADVTVTSQTGNRYNVKYTLSPDMPVPEGERAITITATDRFLTPTGEVVRSVSDTTVHVTVVPSEDELPGLSIDVNSFNPSRGQQATIRFGRSQGSATISVYNMRGSLVKTLSADDVSSLAWSGQTDDGDIAASGVYFLRIKTDDGEATRKVAIVK